MSLYVTCQCGQAFSAPEELAGQTLPCPMCQRPIAVIARSAPLATPPAAPPAPFASQGAFASMPSMSAPLHSQPVARGEEDSPLVVWLLAIGGGLALVLVIGMIVYNATRRPAPQVATTTTAANAANPPSSAVPGATPATPSAAQPEANAPATAPLPTVAATQESPAQAVNTPATSVAPPPQAIASPTPHPPQLPVTAAPIPVATQLPAANAPAAADPAPEAAPFTPPNYGGMIATPDGKYEVWLPSAPQKFDPSLDLAALLPKPKGGNALIAFGKQGPTEMCSVAITPGATAAEVYGEMERAFPGQPDTKTIKFAGVDARQYDFAIEITEGKFAIRAIAFALDGNGYTLLTLSITGQKETDETRAFFASFRKKAMAE